MLCCSPLTLCQALDSHACTGAGCSLSPGKQVRHVAEHAALVTGWQASTSCFLQGLQLKRWMLPLLQWHIPFFGALPPLFICPAGLDRKMKSGKALSMMGRT